MKCNCNGKYSGKEKSTRNEPEQHVTFRKSKHGGYIMQDARERK